MSKPNIKEFMDATGADFLTASNVIYGDVGANLDTRDWGAIMSSADPLGSARSGLASMYSDPAYREANTAHVVAQGYDPAQAFYTYNQMNDRVGATYVPTLDEVNAVNNYFEKLNVPDVRWSFDGNKLNTNAGTTPRTSTVNTSNTGTGSSVVNQITSGDRTLQQPGMGSMSPGSSNWNARQAVGASDKALMGAGNADYNSSLIKSLRQSSLTPFSTNTGVLMAPNQGASTSSLVPSMDQMGGAFNPQVLNPRAASDQEVADWNAYSTYRTNALNAKTPVLSMAEWLAGGKSDGKAPTNTTPTPDYQYDGGG